MKLRALAALCLLTAPVAACFPTAPAATEPDGASSPDTGAGLVDVSAGGEDASPGGDSLAQDDATSGPDASGADASGPAPDVAPADDVAPEADTSAPSEIPLDQLSAAYGAIFCERLATCPNAIEGAGLMAAFARVDENACRDWAAGRLAVEVMQDVDAGLVAYDAAAAAACLANLAGSCVLGTEEDPTCARVFSGLLPQGKVCERDNVCQPGLHCAFGDTWQCGGVCTPSPKLGEPCKDAGSRCSQADGPAFCNHDGDRCALRPAPITAAPGGRCGGDASPENPGALVVCPGRHVCTLLPNASDATCEPILAPDAACDSGGACPVGTLCRPSGTGAACQAYGIASTAGEVCNETPQSGGRLIYCNMFLSLACGPTSGVCELRTGREGDACSGQHPCNEGLFCSARGVCMQPAADGERCNADDGCRSGACINGVCGAPACPPR